MGNNSSSTSTLVNKAMTESIMNVSKSCAAEANNVSGMNLKSGDAINLDLSGNINQKATTSLIKCDQKTNLQAAMKSQMASSDYTKALAQGNSLWEGNVGLYTRSKTSSDVVNNNIFKQNIDDVMHCLAKAGNVHIIKAFAKGDINIKDDQGSDQNASASVSSCLQTTKSMQDMASKINNEISSSSKSIGLFGTLLDGAKGIISSIVAIAIPIGIVVMVIFLIRYQLNKKKNNNKTLTNSNSSDNIYSPKTDS